MDLSERLVLNKYLLSLFDVEELADFKSKDKKTLRDVLNPKHIKEGFNEEGKSYLLETLLNCNLNIDDNIMNSLEKYDNNIKEYCEHINMIREEKIDLKYFQYLAVLFTEIFLDKYFNDKKNFISELNGFIDKKNHKRARNKFSYLKESDLNKLAYYMATGSGKTIIMHINFLQFLKYKKEELDNIILITPNHGLTKQHLEELQKSNIDADYLLNLEGRLLKEDRIYLIEIHKLSETKKGEGESREISEFEGKNLIFVDEGHKGSGGDVWKNNREALAEEGFIFEYSATFGQAVGNKLNESERWDNDDVKYSKKVDDLDLEPDIQGEIFKINKCETYIKMSLYELQQKIVKLELDDHIKQRIEKMYENLIEEYSKAIIFDYSYKFFYNDGYGKDYDILNLKKQMLEEYNYKYMMANLLNFYEQKKYYENKKNIAKESYNIENPLLMFVGHTVTANGNLLKAGASDIEFVISFFNNFLENSDDYIGYIDDIVFGRSGFVDQNENDIFSSKFRYINGLDLTSEEIYADIKRIIFHTSDESSSIEIFDIKNGDGEMGLTVKNKNKYFAVINIGDVPGLSKKLEESGHEIETDEFKNSLFTNINSEDSNINILIGSKKFTEGWNSYRVSAIGLLNVGKTEGSQIIQLFGRGVRLKGLDKSLKRSEFFSDINHPPYIYILETLNVFGIKADYMDKFREYLDDEGIETSQKEIIDIPLERDEELLEENLLTLKVDESYNFKEEEFIELEPTEECMVELDLRPRTEALSSRLRLFSPISETTGKTIDEKHLDIMDWDDIYLDVINYKKKKDYYNLYVDKKSILDIVYNEYYSLICNDDVLEPEKFEEIFELQDIVVSILQKYINRFYRRYKTMYEDTKLRYKQLTPKDEDHFIETRIKINKELDNFIEEVKQMKRSKILYKKTLDERPNVDNIYFDRHLFQPLLCENELVDYTLSPEGLNKGEKNFVNLLKSYFEENEKDNLITKNEIFLLRNFERRGISFFEANNFYPDFVLWIKPLKSERQYINFFDPKGLMKLEPDNVKFDLSHSIKEKEKLLRKRTEFNVVLNSFIISISNYKDVRDKYSSLDASLNRKEDFEDRNIYFIQDGFSMLDRVFYKILKNQ